MSEEVALTSLSKLCNAIDTANLRGGFNGSDCSQNEGGLTMIKAEEKYNTRMSTMVDLCARDPPSDLRLM